MPNQPLPNRSWSNASLSDLDSHKEASDSGASEPITGQGRASRPQVANQERRGPGRACGPRVSRKPRRARSFPQAHYAGDLAVFPLPGEKRAAPEAVTGRRTELASAPPEAAAPSARLLKRSLLQRDGPAGAEALEEGRQAPPVSPYGRAAPCATGDAQPPPGASLYEWKLRPAGSRMPRAAFRVSALAPALMSRGRLSSRSAAAQGRLGLECNPAVCSCPLTAWVPRSSPPRRFPLLPIGNYKP